MASGASSTDGTRYECEATLRVPAGIIWKVQQLPSGQVAILCQDGTIQIYDRTGSMRTLTLSGLATTLTGRRKPMIFSMAIISESRIISATSVNGAHDDAGTNSIEAWDLNDGSSIAMPGGHPQVGQLLAGLPDHRHFVSGSHDGSLKVWELSDDGRVGRCLHTLLGHTGSVLCLEAVPDGTVLSGSNDGAVRVWDAIAGRCLRVLVNTGRRGFYDFIWRLPDGRVVACDYETVDVWDITAGRLLRTLNVGSVRLNAGNFFCDGRVIVCASEADRTTLKAWDTIDGTCMVMRTEHTGYIRDVGALPDGRAASSYDDGTIKIWDVSQGRCLQTLSGQHANEVWWIIVLANGRFMSLDQDDGIGKIWFDWRQHIEKIMAVRVRALAFVPCVCIRSI